LLVFLFLSSFVYATPQVNDALLYEGKWRSIWYVDPLESQITPEITEKWFSKQNSASLDGYFAKWEIDNNYLVLTDIKHFGPGPWNLISLPLSVISPNWSNKVRATWYSGKFITPILQSRSNYGLPIYIAREFRIEQGRVTAISLVFPFFQPMRTYLFVLPLLIAVIGLSLILLKLRKRKKQCPQ
jgi:hypothetical protein